MNYSRFALLAILGLPLFLPHTLRAQTTTPTSDSSAAKSAGFPKSEYLDFAEEEPSFEYRELQRNLIYPRIAAANGIEGTVVVTAYINDKGIVAWTEIYKSDNPIFNDAAVEAVKNTKFTPGKKNGQPVRCKITIPIKFMLN